MTKKGHGGAVAELRAGSHWPSFVARLGWDSCRGRQSRAQAETSGLGAGRTRAAEGQDEAAVARLLGETFTGPASARPRLFSPVPTRLRRCREGSGQRLWAGVCALIPSAVCAPTSLHVPNDLPTFPLLSLPQKSFSAACLIG